MPFGVNIPTAGDIGQELQKAEDHLMAGVDAEVKTVRQQVEEILSEWEVVVSFRKKVAPKEMGTPQ